MPINAVLYLRVSTEDQAADDKTSLDQQEADCRREAEHQGWNVSHVYRDEGVSGSKALADRPQGAQMLEDAALGQFSKVVVAKIDRWTRSTAAGLADIKTMIKLGVDVVLLDLDVDTGTPAGEAMLGMMAIFATFERKTIVARTTLGRQGVAAAGRWPGGRTPFGWTTSDDAARTLVVDEAQAPTLVRIFTLVADGHGPKYVADLLNDEGQPPATKGGTWVHQTVTEAIRRKAYHTGVVERKQGGVRYSFPAPVLIDPDVWRQANAAVDAQKAGRGQQKRKAVQRRYALSGALDHVHTDGTVWPMTGRYKPKAKVGRYLHCASVYHADADCSGFYTDHTNQVVKALPAAKLEAGVLLWGLALLNDPQRLAEWSAAYDRQSLGELGDDAKLLAQAIKRRAAQLDRKAEITKGLLAGTLTHDDAAETMAEIDAKVVELDDMISRYAGAQGHADALQLSIATLRDADVGTWLAKMHAAEITHPAPGEIDPRDAGAWQQVSGALEREARAVLEGINAMGVGRPKTGAPAPRDMEPWAQEWVQTLVQRFSLAISVQTADTSTWDVKGAVPQTLNGSGTVRFTTTLAA